MNKKIVLFLVLTALMFTSCMLPTLRRQADKPADIKEGEVIIVGKVEYDPPFTDKTQNLQPGYDFYKNMIFLLCGQELKYLSNNSMLPGSGDFEGAISAYHGEPFYAVSLPEPFYVVAAGFYKNIYTTYGYNSSTTHYESVASPASFRIDLRPGDRAVYVGTIRYYRDNFFDIKKIQIIDEYDREMPAFRRAFGNIPLRKALIRQPPAGFEYGVGDPY